MSLPSYENSDCAEPIRQRLSDLASSGGSAGKAGQLLGRLGPPPPLSEAAMARIEGNLLSTAPTGAAAASLVRWLGIGATVAAVAGASYFATTRQANHRHVQPQTLSAPATSSLPAPTMVVSPPPSSEAVVAATAEEPAPAVRPPARAVRNRKVPTVTASAPVAAPPTAPPPVEDSALLVESQLLGQALHQLHQGHDATSALASLNAYETRFPHGLLGEEAQAAKVDALLMLSRRGEALALLDRVTFSRLGRGGELRAVRGELRANAGRCREALGDFSWALGHQPTAGTEERSLYGRAACKQTMHNSDGARVDYNDYLQRFPAGKFAAAANAALRDLPED